MFAQFFPHGLKELSGLRVAQFLDVAVAASVDDHAQPTRLAVGGRYVAEFDRGVAPGPALTSRYSRGWGRPAADPIGHARQRVLDSSLLFCSASGSRLSASPRPRACTRTWNPSNKQPVAESPSLACSARSLPSSPSADSYSKAVGARRWAVPESSRPVLPLLWSATFGWPTISSRPRRWR